MLEKGLLSPSPSFHSSTFAYKGRSLCSPNACHVALVFHPSTIFKLGTWTPSLVRKDGSARVPNRRFPMEPESSSLSVGTLDWRIGNDCSHGPRLPALFFWDETNPVGSKKPDRIDSFAFRPRSRAKDLDPPPIAISVDLVR